MLILFFTAAGTQFVTSDLSINDFGNMFCPSITQCIKLLYAQRIASEPLTLFWTIRGIGQVIKSTP